ncbi:MAG: hypothetical protein HS111_12970 [Kofleriaceae bacterium]|nr:hypothetical protein [Kofleriaceae bacterium]
MVRERRRPILSGRAGTLDTSVSDADHQRVFERPRRPTFAVPTAHRGPDVDATARVQPSAVEVLPAPVRGPACASASIAPRAGQWIASREPATRGRTRHLPGARHDARRDRPITRRPISTARERVARPRGAFRGGRASTRGRRTVVASTSLLGAGYRWMRVGSAARTRAGRRPRRCERAHPADGVLARDASTRRCRRRGGRARRREDARGRGASAAAADRFDRLRTVALILARFLARRPVLQRGRATVVADGSTPRQVMRKIARAECANRLAMPPIVAVRPSANRGARPRPRHQRHVAPTVVGGARAARAKARSERRFAGGRDVAADRRSAVASGRAAHATLARMRTRDADESSSAARAPLRLAAGRSRPRASALRRAPQRRARRIRQVSRHAPARSWPLAGVTRSPMRLAPRRRTAAGRRERRFSVARRPSSAGRRRAGDRAHDAASGGFLDVAADRRRALRRSASADPRAPTGRAGDQPFTWRIR